MQFLSKDDRFSEIAHGFAQSPALTAQVQVRLFFCESITMLKDALGSLDHLSCFERPFHL